MPGICRVLNRKLRGGHPIPDPCKMRPRFYSTGDAGGRAAHCTAVRSRMPHRTLTRNPLCVHPAAPSRPQSHPHPISPTPPSASVHVSVPPGSTRNSRIPDNSLHRRKQIRHRHGHDVRAIRATLLFRTPSTLQPRRLGPHGTYTQNGAAHHSRDLWWWIRFLQEVACQSKRPR